jgi:DNA primase
VSPVRPIDVALPILRAHHGSGSVPRSLVDDVRNHVDIVRRIQPAVELTAAIDGGVKYFDRFVGRCPFCCQALPSFEVFRSKRIWICRACERAGDVFRFVMETRRVTFLEAVIATGEEGEGDDNPF